MQIEKGQGQLCQSVGRDAVSVLALASSSRKASSPRKAASAAEASSEPASSRGAAGMEDGVGTFGDAGSFFALFVELLVGLGGLGPLLEKGCRLQMVRVCIELGLRTSESVPSVRL